MLHPSHSPALRAVAAPASGTVATDQFGLTIVQLSPRGPATRPPPPPLFSELDPPDPGTLVAANPTPRVAGLALGDTLVGGMSDRAVVEALVLPPGASAVVAVEPLSARWWPGHLPQPGPPLSPALTALLILARQGGRGLRSIARTALWEGYRRREVTGDVRGPYGWVLLGSHTVLAAHLVQSRIRWPPAAPRPRGTPATPPTHLPQEDDADTGVVQLTHSHGRRIEVWLVRASPELPDAVLDTSG
jgi:hypothetical protein